MADQNPPTEKENQTPTPTITVPLLQEQNPNHTQTQAQQQQPPKKRKQSSSSIKEITTTTMKTPPFAYIHLSTFHSSSSGSIPIIPATRQGAGEEIIDPLQVRSYCTAALQRFLGDTGTAIVPDILLIRSKEAEADIYLRVPRQDLGAFAAAITAYPGRQIPTGSGGSGWLLLQIKSCGDWLGSLIGKAEEKDIWDRD